MFNGWPADAPSYIFQATPQQLQEQQEKINALMNQILKQISQINTQCSKPDKTETNIPQKQYYISAKPIPQAPQHELDYESDQFKDKKSFKKRKSKYQRVYIQGRWSVREHRQYLQFLDKFYLILNQADLKSEQQIFKKMSQQIRTRTPTQCRSHHKRFDFQGYLLKINQNSNAT